MNSKDLDNHITGHYSEDQFCGVRAESRQILESLVDEKCPICGEDAPDDVFDGDTCDCGMVFSLPMAGDDTPIAQDLQEKLKVAQARIAELEADGKVLVAANTRFFATATRLSE